MLREASGVAPTRDFLRLDHPRDEVCRGFGVRCPVVFNRIYLFGADHFDVIKTPERAIGFNILPVNKL